MKLTISIEAPTSQLYQVTNLALLCETAIEGLIAANPFQANSLDDGTMSSFSEASPVERRDKERLRGKPEIVLDLEDREWNYKVEAGTYSFHLVDMRLRTCYVV